MKYSDLAIETALTLRPILNLPLRRIEGFLNSLFVMIVLELSSPDHTTMLVTERLNESRKLGDDSGRRSRATSA